MDSADSEAETAEEAAPVAIFDKRGGHMAKIPDRPEEIFGELTDDLKKAFGDDLISIILYGSGAGPDYKPGKSDLNFLVTLSESGIFNLHRILDLLKRWRKRNVATPLVMTKAFLISSLDSYPIEFINMKRHYVKVYGEDVLEALTFKRENIRIQIERELKGKLLLLRTGFLETEGKPHQIRDLINVSLTAFLSAFRALLYLKGLEIPNERRSVISEAAAAFSIDASVFLKCSDIKDHSDRLTSSEVRLVFDDYLKEVDRLCTYVDGMDV